MFGITEQKLECSFPEAVALSALGALPEIDVYVVEATGKKWDQWALRGPSIPFAAPILTAARLPVDHPESLERTAPAHPYLAGRYALETHERLEAWIRTPLEVPVFTRTRGPLCRLDAPGAVIPSGPPFCWTPALVVPDLCHAAALIVCGFVPVPKLWETPGRPVGIGFAAGESATMPGITWPIVHAAARASVRPDGVIDCSALRIGDTPAGEHPWCFALQSLAHAGAARGLRREAGKDPTLIMRGRGQRSAIVSLSVTEESFSDSSIRDQLPRHLKP